MFWFQIQDWVLLKKIGEGGFGRVYKAKNIISGEEVGICGMLLYSGGTAKCGVFLLCCCRTAERCVFTPGVKQNAVLGNWFTLSVHLTTDVSL